MNVMIISSLCRRNGITPVEVCMTYKSKLHRTGHDCCRCVRADAYTPFAICWAAWDAHAMHAEHSRIPCLQGQGQHHPPPPLSLLVHQTLQSRLCPPVNRHLA